MIDVAVLGPLAVHDPARGALASLLAQPRRAALLACLVIEGGDGYVARDRLLGLFWPESDESRARAALRQALSFLRRVLGADAVRTRGDDAVGVDPAHLSSDLWRFRAHRRAGRLDEALALVRGELLEGLVVDDAPAFEHWCVAHRDRIRRELSAAVADAADAAATAGDLRRALALAARGLALTPLDETAHRRRLALLDRAGDRAGALDAHARFAAQLAAELEVAPSPETEALVQAIRERSAVRERTAAGVESAFGAESTFGAESASRLASASRAESASRAASPSSVTNEKPEAGGARSPTLAINQSTTAPFTRRYQSIWVIGGAILVALTVGIMRRPPASPPDAAPALSPHRIAVLPLAAPGDSSATVGAMAADWIVDGLSRLDGIEVVPLTAVLASESGQRTGDTADGAPANGAPTDGAPAGAARTRTPAAAASEPWTRIAAEVGAGVVVRGTVYREGGRLLLQAQLLETATGRLLRPVDRVEVPADSLMAGIDRLRVHVLAAVAPLTDTITHLARAATPPTADAYRDYVTGLQRFMRDGDPAEALRLYQRALAVSPAWPMPRIAAAIMHTNLGQADSADALLAPLRPERERLGPLEAATFDMIDGMLRGDLAAAYDAALHQARLAPGSIGHYMVAELARRLNRPEEALAVLDDLDPDRGELRGWRPYWRERTYALHLLGRFADEAGAAREAIRRDPNYTADHAHLVRALASAGDTARLDAALEALDAAASGTTARAEGRALALTYIVRYRPTLAPVAGRRLLGWFDALPAEARDAPAVRAQEARSLLAAGRPAEARTVLAPLAGRTDLPPVLVARFGLVAAAVGDTAEARRWSARLAADAAAQSPAARGLAWGEHAYWRAAIAARLGDRDGALELLRQARREGLAMDPGVASEPSFATLRDWPPFRAALAR